MRIIIKLCILIYILITLIINIRMLSDNKIEVTAHRGDSLNYPENTMSAFINAKKLEADYIELDVHQTKDNLLVVIHNHELKIGNKLKKISDINYEELSKISFEKNEITDKIPLLEDAIKFAKDNNIKLNIDLKKGKNTKSYVKSVVDLINKYDFAENCIISSFKYDLLLSVKDISNIKTLYIIGNMNKDYLDLNVDGYSIQKNNINKELVEIIHDKGKEVHVWTVNNEIDIKKMIEFRVDNIITDNVELVKEIISD